MIFHDWTETEIMPDPFAWYQYTPTVSGHNIIYDSVADKHIVGDAGNSPVLTENVLGAHPGWYFNGTRDPLTYSGDVTIKHAFILASNEDATFATYQGLLTGETSGDVLVGDNGTTKFFDLGLGVTYTNEGIAYDEDDQQAPMSGTFRLLEVSLSAGFGLDGIQVGQQKADTSRRWQGHFIEMVLFDRVLTTAEVRRVRLYFNVKFGEWARGLRFEFPSADIVPTIGPSRFYDVPPDYKSITDEWEYEDRVKDFNEVADEPPKFWEYAYPAVPKAHLPIYNEFWNQARLVNPFYFKDPDRITWSNVRVDDYNRNHQAHKRWAHDVAFRLVGYNSVGVPDVPPTLPDPPVGLALEVLSDTEILATWATAPDVTAPTVPTMSAGSVVSDTEIDWSWSAATDDTAVTGYDLQVSTSSDFTTGVTTHNLGNVLTYSSTGLTASTIYYARVRAHDAVPNTSAYSSSVNATTDPPPGWAPSDLPDLVHWFKASTLALSDNDPVGTWDDLNNVADLTATGSTRPTYKANSGDPYVEFDGTDDKLSLSSGGGWVDASAVFIIEIVTTGVDYERIYDAPNLALYTMASGVIQFAELGTGPTEPMPARPTGFMAVYWERNGTTGKIRLDGSETTATVGTSGTSPGIIIGEYNGGGFNKNMRIKEIILCDNNLSGADFTELEAYILAEYGLTL